MSEGKSYWKAIRIFLGVIIISLVFGIGFGLIRYSYQNVCSIKFSFRPLSVEWDCSATFGQVPITFGENPSEWTLEEALDMVKNGTERWGKARVYIDKDIRSLKVLSEKVTPPAGTHPSVDVIYQLLVSAQALDQIQVCIIPTGGYIICRK